MSQADFRSRIVVGRSPARMNLLSTSKKWDVPFGFAAGVSGTKDIAVLWAFDHVGGDCGGRDVTALSAMAREGEILIMVGAPFKIRSVVEVGTAEAKARAGAHAGFYGAIRNQPLMETAEKVYFVHVVGTPKPKAP